MNYRAAVLATLLLLCAKAAPAYVVGDFNAARLTAQSDLVCKIEVLGLQPNGILKAGYIILNPPYADTPRYIATARVISVIKGLPPAELRFVCYGLPTDAGAYGDFTALERGEITIVFLTRNAGRYEYTVNHFGKMAVLPRAGKMAGPPGAAIYPTAGYPPGGEAQANLLTELIDAATNSEPGPLQWRAIQQIGLWGEAARWRTKFRLYSVLDNAYGETPAREPLRHLRASPNWRTRGLACIASLRLGDAPEPESFVSLFVAPNNDLIPAENDISTLVRLRSELMDELRSSTHALLLNADNHLILTDGKFKRGVAGLDYTALCRRLLATPAVQNSAALRQPLVATLAVQEDKSAIPVMAALLTDGNDYVRRTAVTFLSKMINNDNKPESAATYAEREPELLATWTTWWQQNRAQYETPTGAL